ncbi:hypothetical protein B7494_g4958 [Chlorociboria aeruginascens]|nr:hypothetical protein B7494_g4958 [Chlorociboria aeruginascens]
MIDIYELILQWGNNLQTRVSEIFEGMTLQKYIRLVIIVGAYALLRPYLMKLGARAQTREHEKEVDPEEMEKAKAAISPNSLRGQVEVPDDSAESEGETTGADWGKKARRRQRQVVRKILEQDEKLRREQQEDDEDKDIQEFLVD